MKDTVLIRIYLQPRRSLNDMMLKVHTMNNSINGESVSQSVSRSVSQSVSQSVVVLTCGHAGYPMVSEGLDPHRHVPV